MPFPPDPVSPALDRATRAPRTLIGATQAITTGLVTVASGALDPYQNGDVFNLVDAVAGTPMTGGTGVDREADLYLEKVSATTCLLHVNGPAGALAIPTVAITAGAALRYGKMAPSAGVLAPNIVAAGSARGGAFGGPLD